MLKHLISDFCRETGAVIQKRGGINSFRAGFIDSRRMEKGGAFFVLPGEKTHGYKFVADAIRRGAKLIVSDRPVAAVQDRVCVLIHKNPLAALQGYASWCRECYKGLVIGVTGSFGKTSTKDFLGAILKGCGYVSEGNLNNTIGLPLCLLHLSANHDFAVFEAGISKADEMSLLAAMLRPNIAVVTGVGCSHREFFPSRAELVSEKLSLTKYMDEKGSLFIPSDLYQQFAIPAYYKGGLKLLPYFPLSINPMSFSGLHSSGEAYIKDKLQLISDSYAWTEADSLRFTRLFGLGPIQSLQRAFCVASALGLLRRDFRNRLQGFTLSSLRMERRLIHGRNFILDCYNACPESMRAFLESAYKEKEAIVVLGDMLELGEDSLVEHRFILENIDFNRLHSVFVLGDIFSRCVREGDFAKTYALRDKEELKKRLRISGAETFAFKASRSFCLETVAEDLQREGF